MSSTKGYPQEDVNLPRKTLFLRLESIEMGGVDKSGHYWVDVWLADKDERLYHYLCPSNQDGNAKTRFGYFFASVYNIPKGKRIFWNVTARVKEGTRKTYLGNDFVHEQNEERTLLFRPQITPPQDNMGRQLYDSLYKGV